ncbi:MAG: DUF4189 domain-containing protein [Nocardiaceae bacterium]|nr:DUF4189 domain-containing protein [Nocardiaceae bacterium]
MTVFAQDAFTPIVRRGQKPGRSIDVTGPTFARRRLSHVGKVIARSGLVTLAVGVVVAATPGIAGASVTYFGAIAVSPSTSGTGSSYDWSSYAEADLAAKTVCGFTDCQIVLSFSNGCGALAQAANGAWGWARATDLATAKDLAVGQAVHRMHLDGYVYATAEVVNSVCTTVVT